MSVQRRPSSRMIAASLMVVSALGANRARGEVIEKIVAKVNDDIITKSDFEENEQAALADVYRRYTGTELDGEVKRTRTSLLRYMIDRKILLHIAQRRFKMDKMGDEILKSFKEQQQIKSEEEFQRLLTHENFTVADLKRRLVEMYAPEKVVQMEVFDRVSVGDKEIEAYYNAHIQEFDIPGEVTLREIVLMERGDSRGGRRAEAERIRERVTAPQSDFAAVASEISEAGTKAGGGLLGPLKQGELAQAIEELAFKLPVGEVSPVLDMPYGFHIVRVESRTDPRRQTLDEVRQSLRAKIESRKKNIELQGYLKKAWDEATVDVDPAYRNRLDQPSTDPESQPPK